jgi:tetratricopeptide (TPR) repeat protein
VLGVLEALRGQTDAAGAYLAEIDAWKRSDDVEARQLYQGLTGLLALAEGRAEDALRPLETAAIEGAETGGASADGPRLAWAGAIDAALALGLHDRVEELIALLADEPPGRIPPLLRAELSRAQGRFAAERGEHDDVEASLRAAIAGFSELGYPFHLARAQIDLGSWLIDRGRGEEAVQLLADAADIADELAAEPLSSRIRELSATPERIAG